MKVEMAYTLAQGNSGGIMSLWNLEMFDGTIMEIDTNFIWAILFHKVTKKKLNTVNIYTSNKLLERRILWRKLEDIIKNKEEEN